MDDETIRDLFIALICLLSLAFVAGGWFYRVAGVWRDGHRIITLLQWGPFVWGHARFAEGRQRFRGRIFLGRLRLTRWDYGSEHLQSFGFEPNYLAAMEGQATGYFALRVQGPDVLSGEFYGRKFTIKENKMVPVSLAPPAARTWQRDRAADIAGASGGHT